MTDCVIVNEKCGFFRAGEGNGDFRFHVISSFLHRSRVEAFRVGTSRSVADGAVAVDGEGVVRLPVEQL